ncbi:hypothetical protein F4809DRAFT_316096 [Biscogniauxia mediterranea]|nr:hypothetical protein F4809DRAFT_316096 [Biscogniauxia mediterranea]
MASSEFQVRQEIRRVPVPTHPTTVLGSAPRLVAMPESTAGIPAQVSSQGPRRLNGPIPIITTLPQQSTQHQFHSQTQLNPQQQHQPPQARGPTIVLSPQMEEDLKAAVLGTMASTQPVPSQQTATPNKKEARADKWLRCISVVLCILLVVAEVALAIVLGPENDTVYGILWGTLLGIWDIWRLVRVWKKQEGGPVSTWQVVGEGIFMTVTVVLTAILVASLVNISGEDETLIRGWVLTFVFLVLAISHLIFFIRTCAEKWSKPNQQVTELALYHDPKQQQAQQIPVPQFIVQYVHECPHCGNQLGPQPGEDLNEDLASKGDAQPQGVAPAAYLR